VGAGATLAAIVLAFSTLMATPGVEPWLIPATQLPDPVCTVLPDLTVNLARPVT